MAVLESVKERFEKVTGWARPSVRDLDAALRPRKANAFWFKDDGVIPNNPTGKFDPAAVFEELFERNGWGNSLRNGIYDYGHYHSRVHEVLGVARGRSSPVWRREGTRIEAKGGRCDDPAGRHWP